MGARIIKKTLITEGHFYFHQDIQEIIPRLKMISSKKINGLHYYLYRDLSLKTYWISGPLKSSQQILYYYLGSQKLVRSHSSLSGEFKSLLESWSEKMWSILLPTSANNDKRQFLLEMDSFGKAIQIFRK